MTKSKKSYNPFKMWGVYLGIVLAIVLSALAYNASGFDALIYFLPLLPLLYVFSLVGLTIVDLAIEGFLALLLVYIVYGFFVGWGIHSLVRALRK